MTPASPLPTVLEPEHLALGRVYAHALADLVLAGPDDVQALASELTALAATLAETDGAMEMFASPHLRAQDRAQLVDRIFGGRVSEALADLLGVMARNGRMNLLPAVAQAFDHVLDERAGRVEALVTTAVPVDDEQKQSIRQQVADMLGAEPALHYAVDADLIGGMVLRVGDRVYDASVAGELKRMTDSISHSLGEARRQRQAPADDGKEGTQSP